MREEVFKMARKNDKARKQQRASEREAKKRDAWFARQASEPKREQSRALRGIVAVPPRLDFNDMDMMRALKYVVDINTEIVHGKIPEDSPTVFLLVNGEQQTTLMFAIDEGFSADPIERQKDVRSLGRAVGSAPWATDICAVFLTTEARMRNYETLEVIKEVLVTGGVRPDGTDAVIALQDTSCGADGNILLSSAEMSEDVAAPILLSFLDGLHSAINQRKSA